MTTDIREARPDDRSQVLEFASDTWEGWDYLPDVWSDWLEEGTLLVAETNEGPVGVIHVTAYLTGEAWLEGARVHPDHRREGVATQLTERALQIARERGAEVVRCMTFDWNDPGKELVEALGFRRVAEIRHARSFGFPYGTSLEDATFDASLDAVRETEAFEEFGGLYVTRDWKALRIPETVGNFQAGAGILALEENNDVRAIMISDGVRTNTRGVDERTELVLGFTWCDPDYASSVALDVRAEVREREINDALVFLPDSEDIVTSFEQAGYDVSEPDYIYEKEIGVE